MKRFLSFFLCLMFISFLCGSIGILVYAEDLDSTPLSITAKTIPKPTYCVTIPKKVDFGIISKDNGTVKQPMNVSVTGISKLYANQQRLIVTITSKNSYYLLDDAKKNKLSYQLYLDDEQTPQSASKILDITGTETADTNLSKIINSTATVDTSKIKKAGIYTDILTFTVALDEVTNN